MAEREGGRKGGREGEVDVFNGRVEMPGSLLSICVVAQRPALALLI